MKINKTVIIDERQEKQSLQNNSIVCSVMFIMLCVMLLIQTFFMQRGFSYYGPEFITLMTGCVLKLVLDIRQGNAFVLMNSKIKLPVILYLTVSLIFAVSIGIRNYILYDFDLWMIVFVIVPIFLEMLVLMVAVHFIYRTLSARKLKKLEQKLDEDEFEE